MEKGEFKQIEKWAKKILQDDYDKFDIEQEVDRKISVAENKTILRGKFKVFLNGIPQYAKAEIKTEQEKEEYEQLQQFKEDEQQALRVFESDVYKLKEEKTTEVLENSFYVLKKLIKTLVKSKNINGLIICGESGWGKSWNVLKSFSEIGLKQNDDYCVLTSYSTPLELYAFLYENRENKIIFLDDILKIFDNELNIGILLSALWGGRRRIINYFTSSFKLKVPKSFVFNSKIIWCVNNLPKEISHIKSRCYYYELFFDYREKIKLLYELAKVKGIPLEIIDFIKINSDEMTPNLDFRLLFKIYDIKQLNDNWEEIAIALLKRNKKLAIAKQVISNSNSMKDAMVEWKEKTDLSIRQFRRYKSLIAQTKPNLH